jgi:hypothetical protein
MDFIELASVIASKTGKFVSIPRARKLLKTYPQELVKKGLQELMNHKTPHLIPDPLSYIQRIISVELNKNESKEVLSRINIWDAE